MIEINKNHISPVAALLSRAFRKDPLFNYFFPDHNTRSVLSFYTFSFIAAHAHKKGMVVATSGSFEGAAIWLPSEKIERGIIDQVKFGALKMYLKQGKPTIDRQISASNYMKELHKNLLSTPHVYLSTIGIDSAYRGKGMSAYLMRPGLEWADRENIPCYLDTHNADNIRIYQNYGFKVACESVIPGTSVRHWAMIREIREIK